MKKKIIKKKQNKNLDLYYLKSKNSSYFTKY